MSHLYNDRKIINRINRLQGQISAVHKTVLDKDKECLEVIQQVAAVKGAVNGLMNELIEAHLRHHVLHDNDEHQVEIEEFFKILKKYRE
ncbi:metal/formaldehyde-sensitive transcriptional repressor [Acinetobacter sp. B5B]|uniref:metal/formaldehyde-sensitive transcriptional repressor n=1 Tax=Acinetobacter baretiae TaxID=2605383 RepID=UPI0018C318CD|nr:metal/formaldehyde-sensitive transcriptional repressor [Acinetobacter baretiae]MBF7681958.1 metal/formaldehyde-sensitive transcriptional repressor [Acinetobacter baretiae]MBF7685670.1 metal/formaldehyde-sensitive transcriptional repressor [Acinetobacter baretiae]